MGLVPIKVRNDSKEELARYEADIADVKENPGNWGKNKAHRLGNTPSSSDQIREKDFEYLSEKELEKFQKSALDWYARAMPNGFDPDEKEMTAKEILAAIMEKTPSN